MSSLCQEHAIELGLQDAGNVYCLAAGLPIVPTDTRPVRSAISGALIANSYLDFRSNGLLMTLNDARVCNDSVWTGKWYNGDDGVSRCDDYAVTLLHGEPWQVTPGNELSARGYASSCNSTIPAWWIYPFDLGISELGCFDYERPLLCIIDGVPTASPTTSLPSSSPTTSIPTSAPTRPYHNILFKGKQSDGNFGIRKDSNKYCTELCKTIFDCSVGYAFISYQTDSLRDLPFKYGFNGNVTITTGEGIFLANNFDDLLSIHSNDIITYVTEGETYFSGTNVDGTYSKYNCENWSVSGCKNGKLGIGGSVIGCGTKKYFLCFAVNATSVATFAPTTVRPTLSPTLSNPTFSPTKYPSRSPTNNPTKSPTHLPSKTPSKNPSKSPTTSPTKAPTNPFNAYVLRCYGYNAYNYFGNSDYSWDQIKTKCVMTYSDRAFPFLAHQNKSVYQIMDELLTGSSAFPIYNGRNNVNVGPRGTTTVGDGYGELISPSMSSLFAGTQIGDMAGWISDSCRGNDIYVYSGFNASGMADTSNSCYKDSMTWNDKTFSYSFTTGFYNNLPGFNYLFGYSTQQCAISGPLTPSNFVLYCLEGITVPPTTAPTKSPTSSTPSKSPTPPTTLPPTKQPTALPTKNPTLAPTAEQTASDQPTVPGRRLLLPQRTMPEFMSVGVSLIVLFLFFAAFVFVLL